MSSIENTIEVEASADHAYEMWNQFERFPQYFKSIEKVVSTDADTMTWTVDILGVSRDFDVAVTERITGKRIAWSTVEGTEHSGVVTFHHLDDNKCQVALQMEFAPEGLAEQIADKAQIAKIAANYELGEFKAVAEQSRPDRHPA